MNQAKLNKMNKSANNSVNISGVDSRQVYLIVPPVWIVHLPVLNWTSFGKFMKGRVHEYNGPARLIFFREIPEPTPEDPNKVIRIAIAQTLIPSGIQDAILLFTIAPKNGDTRS